MNKRTYRIIGATLAIPGVPGTWHAGQEVDVNTDTNEVLAIRLLPTTPEDADTEQSTEEHSTQPLQEPLEYPTVSVEGATDTIDEGNIE